MDSLSLVHIIDFLVENGPGGCFQNWRPPGLWSDPMVVGQCRDFNTLCIPHSMLQEVKTALPPAFLKQVLQEGAPHPPLTSGPLELIIVPLPHQLCSQIHNLNRLDAI